jgi:hypothetical protein
MSDTLLRGKIQEVRQRSRGVRVGAGVAQCVMAALGLIAGFFLIDWLVVSRILGEASADKWTRVALLAAMLAAFLYAFWRLVWNELQRVEDDDTVALRIERGHPELKGRLISTVQLTRELRLSPALATSGDLIGALEAETIDASRAINFSDIINFGAIKKAALVALGLVLFAAGLAAWRADFAKTLLSRLTLGSVDYPTAARIVSLTPGGKIPRGEPFTAELRLDAQGFIPDEATLEVRSASGETAILPMVKAPDQADASLLRYICTMEHVLEDCSFRAIAHDARVKAWQELAVLQRPEIKSLQLRYDFPAYANKPSETSTIGDLRALAGTNVHIDIRLNKPVTRARLQARTPTAVRDPIDLPLSENGTLASADIAVTENGFYKILLTCVDGFDNLNPIDYSVTAVKDRAPTVKITRPTQDKHTTNFARQPIAFTVRDDFGIGKGRIMYRVQSDEAPVQDDQAASAELQAEAPAHALELDGLAAHVNAKELAGEYTFALAAIKAQDGQRVEFWLEIDDNCSPQPNVGASSRFHFTVVDRAGMEEILERERRNAVNQITESIKKQKDARDEVDQIRREQLAPTPSQPQPRKP